jgi:hypothetical protein
MLTQYGNYHINYKSDGYDTYRCHIFPIQYNPFLEIYYNNNQKFLQKRLDKKIIHDSKIFEKTQIKWFSFRDIQKNKKYFRKFYQNIIDLLLDNKDTIQLFIMSSKLFNKKIVNKKTLKHKLNRNRNIKTRRN